MPAKKAAGADLFRARQAFATILGDRTILVQPGTVVAAGDPILKGRESLFEPFAPDIRDFSGRVEQATAAPGEKRG